jgi:hypothetical protein
MNYLKYVLVVEVIVFSFLIGGLYSCSVKPQSSINVLLENGYSLNIAIDEMNSSRWKYDNVFMAFEDGFNDDYIKVVALSKSYSDTCIFQKKISTDNALSLADGFNISRYNWYVVSLNNIHFIIYMPPTISAIYINREGEKIKVLLSNKVHTYR